MDEHHFLRDYDRYVEHLIKTQSLDVAMSRAVGGGFKKTGLILAEVVRHFGLADSMQIVDFGCGSGRLAYGLSRTMKVEYAGIDIVPGMVKYAAHLSPPHYRFMVHRDLSFPIKAAKCDMIAAFSVFTHLHPPETWVYLQGMAKALKPGGRIVFSYLDIDEPDHWQEFVFAAEKHAAGAPPHLNAFIAKSWIALWAQKLGLTFEHYVRPDGAPWGGAALGQALAVLRRPPEDVLPDQ